MIINSNLLFSPIHSHSINSFNWHHHHDGFSPSCLIFTGKKIGFSETSRGYYPGADVSSKQPNRENKTS
ncbi:hypothetical protein LguiA_028584 [Lonicera macranthoides]